jgi:hypothetical protein
VRVGVLDRGQICGECIQYCKIYPAVSCRMQCRNRIVTGCNAVVRLELTVASSKRIENSSLGPSRGYVCGRILLEITYVRKVRAGDTVSLSYDFYVVKNVYMVRCAK